MSSIAIGARQLKIHAPQGRWFPGVFVVVAAAVVGAATKVVLASALVLVLVVVAAVVVAAAVVLVEVVSLSLVAAMEEVLAAALVLVAVVVFVTGVVLAATVVLVLAVVLIVVVVAAVVVAAVVVLDVAFSWSLMPKHFWQSGLLTRRCSDLWWQRHDIAISATWSDHFVCHLDAFVCFCVMDLQGPAKKLGPDLLFSRHIPACAWAFADFSLFLYAFPHLSHVQGTIVGGVSGVTLPFAFAIILLASSPNR